MKHLSTIFVILFALSLMTLHTSCCCNNAETIDQLTSVRWIRSDKDTTGIPPGGQAKSILINFEKEKKNACTGFYTKILIYDTISYLEKGKWEFKKKKPSIIIIKDNEEGNDSIYKLELVIISISANQLQIKPENDIIKLFAKDTIGRPPPFPKPPVPSILVQLGVY